MRLLPVAVASLCGGLSLAAAATKVQAQTYNQIYSFMGHHGATPESGVIELSGRLFGTTYAGGALGACRKGCGTVFSIDLKTGKQKVVHAFQGGADGLNPIAGLTVAGGLLYGTTEGGGHFANGDQYGSGTVFSIDPRTGIKTIVYDFQSGSDGAAPNSSLIEIAGILYGTTLGGGNGGTVYSINPASGAHTTIYAFQGGNDARDPSGDLLYVGGRLYGNASSGGSKFLGGAIFSVDPLTGSEAILYVFGASRYDGDAPRGNLTKVGNELYGTTAQGGANNTGIVFRVSPASGKEDILYSFDKNRASSGANGGLIDLDGVLYGTTGNLGNKTCSSGGCGTIFSFDVATGMETVLYAFGANANDGTIPLAPLNLIKGTFYGTTYQGGGPHNAGTVFAFTP